MNDKKYNKTLAPLYRTASDNSMSIIITPDIFDAIQEVKVGGKLFVKRNKFKKGDKSPDDYLEYITPEDVTNFAEQRTQRKQDEDSL